MTTKTATKTATRYARMARAHTLSAEAAEATGQHEFAAQQRRLAEAATINHRMTIDPAFAAERGHRLAYAAF
jgi:hypothetical protein